MRSVRARSSAAVCGPRSSRTARRAICAVDRSSARSSRCRCFSLRSPGRCTVRSSSRSRRLRTARRTVATSYSTTGSRLVVWLQAESSELSVNGYCCGVVSCFSTRQPRTRPSSAVTSTRRQRRPGVESARRCVVLSRGMQRRPTDLNIAGAIDLSSLKAPAAAPAAPTSTSAHVIDVTEATFEAEVLQRSMTVPVLIDFWADWCGPCKQLSPVLERLAEADGGAWVLAKMDVDKNPGISTQLQIQSIPTVLLALGGRLIQGFTGALPERDVRSFLDQVLAAAQQAGLPGAGAAPADSAEPAGPPPEP